MIWSPQSIGCADDMSDDRLYKLRPNALKGMRTCKKGQHCQDATPTSIAAIDRHAYTLNIKRVRFSRMELVADARKRTLQNEWKVTSDGLHAMKASSVDASDFLTMDPPSGTWPRFRQARDFAREFTNMVVAWKQQKMMEVEYCGDVNPTTRPSSIEIVEKMELEQCEAPSTGVRVSL